MKHAKTHNRGLFSRNGLAHYNDVLNILEHFQLYKFARKGSFKINNSDLDKYFSSELLRLIVEQPLKSVDASGKFDFKVNIHGGGLKGQAEAIRLAVSRALVKNDEENRPVLKKEGFLTRDPRMVERKKYGRRKARRAFQWVKR